MSPKNKFEEKEYRKVEFLQCACGSKEHILIFELEEYLYDKDIKYVELTTSVFLNNYRNIFKRIWVAVKYIFGYKCKYGQWDCTMIREEDADRLIHMLEEFKVLSKKNAKSSKENADLSNKYNEAMYYPS